MTETLFLQRILTKEVARLDAAMDKVELNLKGWKARGPARIMLLAGWCFARAKEAGDVLIDLRDAELTEKDGEQLAALLSACPRLTSVDVRSNETLDKVGTDALIGFMDKCKVKGSTSVPRSLNGVTPTKSRLEVPKTMPPFEAKLVCAELEANVFAEVRP
jgi:hypothetical protein